MIWMVPPEIVSFCHGEVVQIPTLPSSVIVICSVEELYQVLSVKNQIREAGVPEAPFALL